MTAERILERCHQLATFSEEPGYTTRTFLSPPMHDVHAALRGWSEAAGMTVSVDGAGNFRARYAASKVESRTLYIGSHLDTVPRAGAYDGILGVVMGVELVEALQGRRFPFDIEVVGFSEEEGVRFGVPFIGSRGFIGDVPKEIEVAEAIQAFGVSGKAIPRAPALGYLEFHIEQGPVLDSLNLPLGIVEAIAGQSRFELTFFGAANHAGTTPMSMRRDALVAAAEWIVAVEREATDGLVATVGRIEVEPGAGNVIAGSARVSLDVRHPRDGRRRSAIDRILESAQDIAGRRGVVLSVRLLLDQAAVPMDATLTCLLERAAGQHAHRMTSGAGHDAMIVARCMPAAMLFVRSPGGISHHPDERVNASDVDAALGVGMRFLDELEASLG